MRQHLVYDWPTRIFHWLFSGLFIAGFVIAKTVDSESVIFNYHSILGLTLGFLVLLRLAWGLVGTKHAKFAGFALNPMDLVHYFKGFFNSHNKRWAGHNPASSWAALTMMALGLGLAVTGYLMTVGPDKETYEDLHEIFANGFIVIVILHISGVVIHSFRFREMIGLSMVDGKKSEVAADQTIQSTHSIIGIVLIALVVTFGIQLQFFGSSLQLGDAEDTSDAEISGDTE
jgi:cytochrome b